MNWTAVDSAVADAIAQRHAIRIQPIIVGLAGAQGSGKSTMAPRLAAMLDERGLRTAVLALDDFYLTHARRAALAERIHPLLATRGAPGTHDLALLGSVLDRLTVGSLPVAIPRFDKASDDRAEPIEIMPPFDVVLLEGWCIGARPQDAAELARPVNQLEQDEDPDGTWRSWVNDRLAEQYATLFARIDLRIFLRAPEFAVVERWRAEQETHLGKAAMDDAEMKRFIAHYERITRWMLADEPADLVIDLDRSRTPVAMPRWAAK